MTKDEALNLEQALHELEGIPVYKKYGVRISNAITAIKEALALTSTQCEKQPAQEPEYLYRVDVSRREEGECTKYDHPLYFHNNADANNYCWAINQAPRKRSSIVIAESCAIKMGTISPQRPWVGLTEEDRRTIHDKTFPHRSVMWHGADSYARAIEAKLKEKNT